MTPQLPRVLFVLKRQDRSIYSYSSGSYSSPGLLMSAQFTSEMLQNTLGCASKVVEVIDNNSIDREVALFQPTHVIIDALWVVPEKFLVLSQLHPNVQWTVLIHSRLPFLGYEQVASGWLHAYLQYPTVDIAFNSEDTADSFTKLVGKTNRVWWLPNYYPFTKAKSYWADVTGTELHVGCFGAIRPFKNQLLQAVAAIDYAQQNKLHLNFHINGSRVEQGAASVLQNIRDTFASSTATLVEHPWMTHDEFVAVLRTMHLSMQVSFSESFNIVTADAVVNGIPVVVSNNIDWVNPMFYADPTSTTEIVATMGRSLKYRRRYQRFWDTNQNGLAKESRQAIQQWKKFLGL